MFQEWPKIQRLYSPVVVTEKIDGTNAAVIVGEDGELLGVQSRKRLITPDDDNYGFAAWAYENAKTLVSDLGPGYHYGEWWGRGVNRAYGMEDRRFSLFNTPRWQDAEFGTPNLDTVPVLYDGEFHDSLAMDCEIQLKNYGSLAAPGYMNPEGVVLYFKRNRVAFKYPFGK